MKADKFEFEEIQIFNIRDLVDKQAITRSIADQARTIRIPVHMIETINKLVRTSRQMLHEIGRRANTRRIIRKAIMPLDKVRKILRLLKNQ